jgi:putative hydrolase of the HAD superfamily
VNPPQAIGFDFDHTLGADNGLERIALYAYAAELGRPISPGDEIWRERAERLLNAFRLGEITMDEMIAAFAEALGVAHADTARWQEHCYALVDELVRPIDGAPDLLASLRAHGVPRAILTNGWTPLQHKKIARALGAEARDLPILVSDELRAIKPSRAAFDALVRVLGVPRERCWYAGDNPAGDVAGALAAGLRAVWFNGEGRSYPQDLPPPTLIVESLRELETLIENAIVP